MRRLRNTTLDTHVHVRILNDTVSQYGDRYGAIYALACRQS